jgi:hypothetical protein
MNEALAEHNAGLDIPLELDLKSGQHLPPRTQVPLYKLDKDRRPRRPLPVLMAAYCPFCGDQHRVDEPGLRPLRGATEAQSA